MRWIDFESQHSGLAELGKEKLGATGLALVGTIRRDGAPRISPVNPHFWDGDLYLSMALTSHKVMDLKHDPRILVHNAPAKRDGSDGEYKLRGQAVAITDSETESNFANMVRERYGWGPAPGTIRLFRVDIRDVTFIDRTKSPDPNNPEVTRWSA